MEKFFPPCTCTSRATLTVVRDARVGALGGGAGADPRDDDCAEQGGQGEGVGDEAAVRARYGAEATATCRASRPVRSLRLRGGDE